MNNAELIQASIEQLERVSRSMASIGETEDYTEVAIQALEKQIPKKPILKHDVSVMHINRGDQPHEWK